MTRDDSLPEQLDGSAAPSTGAVPQPVSADAGGQESAGQLSLAASIDEPGLSDYLRDFPDPVRDPDTGMIIPQSRKERKALEAAREKYQQLLADGSVSAESDGGGVALLAQPESLEPLPEDERQYPEAVPATQDPEPADTVEDADTASEPEPQKKASRAGRDLPAAIIVGAVLLGAAAAGLLWQPIIVMVLIMALLILGVWELAQIFKKRDLNVPVVPLWFGSVAIPIAAYFGGIDAMVFALFGTMILAVFWIAVGEPHKPLPTLAATVFILIWVPFLLSFGVAMLRQPHGAILVAIVLLGTVASDTGGYFAGIFFGKHPMAPKISPKKSWEGFVGSLIGSILVTTLLGYFFLDTSIWYLVAIGVVFVLTGTTGDFSASMFKRDLGVKDMGHTLPGHGGVMDRLDSIVFSAPVAFTIFLLITP